MELASKTEETNEPVKLEAKLTTPVMDMKVIEAQHKILSKLQEKLAPLEAELKKHKEQLAELCLAYYRKTGEVKPVSGVDIQIRTILDYNTGLAEDEAKEHFKTFIHLDHSLLMKHIRDDLRKPNMKDSVKKKIELVVTTTPKAIISTRLYAES